MKILSLRIIIALIIGIGIISVGVWHIISQSAQISQDKQEQSPKKTQEQLRKEYIAKKRDADMKASEKDTDGDGIKDWQEILYGLNPNKKDSDDDGVPDTLENIQVKTSTTSTQNKEVVANATTSTTSLTVAMTRQIFAEYVRAKQAQSFDKDEFQKYIADMTAQAYQKGALPQEGVFNQEDIEHIVKPTFINVKNYKDAVATAAEPLSELGEYELTVYGDAVKSDNPEDYARLRDYANTYRRVAQNIILLPVPKDIVAEHLRLANSYMNFAVVLDKLADSQSDPMLSFIAIREFLDTEKDIQTVFAHMNVYFKVDHHLE